MTRAPTDRALERAARAALAEDRFHADRTTRALGIGQGSIRARVIAQGPGILSGMRAARAVARSAGLSVHRALPDGVPVRRGTTVVEIHGDPARVLSAERTILNYLMHLSGVASATSRAVAAVRGSRPPLEIRATRKTLPGLRDLEKAAVVHGGGHPHRRDLSDAVLVKGNHIALLGASRALARLRTVARSARSVEVEVRTGAEAVRAAKAGVRAILIDNASPARARGIVRDLEAHGVRRGLFIELSGGITPRSARRYRRVGANALSLGALTHSAPALPFHLVVVAHGRRAA
ncbi:MAG: carboxylating nicotinate-nucleotide diphosphorylase [Thermoplasmata archaeon]